MKKGDLVRLKKMHEEAGKFGIIIKVHRISADNGQIVFLANGTRRAVPWFRRDEFLEVVSENR